MLTCYWEKQSERGKLYEVIHLSFLLSEGIGVKKGYRDLRWNVR